MVHEKFCSIFLVSKNYGEESRKKADEYGETLRKTWQQVHEKGVALRYSVNRVIGWGLSL